MQKLFSHVWELPRDTEKKMCEQSVLPVLSRDNHIGYFCNLYLFCLNKSMFWDNMKYKSHRKGCSSRVTAAAALLGERKQKKSATSGICSWSLHACLALLTRSADLKPRQQVIWDTFVKSSASVHEYELSTNKPTASEVWDINRKPLR